MNAPESAKLYDPGLESTGERADLLASSGDDAPKTQIIAIYGKGGIGKSFTLANLSYMMAQQGKKVLLNAFEPLMPCSCIVRLMVDLTALKTLLTVFQLMFSAKHQSKNLAAQLWHMKRWVYSPIPWPRKGRFVLRS